MLIMPQRLQSPKYAGQAPKEKDLSDLENDESQEVQPGPTEEEESEPEIDVDVDSELSKLPHIQLRHDRIPAALDPGRFFKIMVETVLANTRCPITRKRGVDEAPHSMTA